MVGRNCTSLPPGFRFHPTDEELIMYYLRYRATSMPCPASIIPEVDIYKFDPWELPTRPSLERLSGTFSLLEIESTLTGYDPIEQPCPGIGKPCTGTDKSIYSGSKYVGIKKALVFYKGKPPKGIKTNWIMHEYRLTESKSQPYKQNGSMRLDDWVLCRIYKKKSLGKANSYDGERVIEDQIDHAISEQQQYNKFPRISSLTHLWEIDNIGSISDLMNENVPFNSQETISNNNEINQLSFEINPMYELQ
ncbi:hypothetical protein CASFOL_024165 [Castilleja foliolosa]|uniref:NAC domain-containing protein n=1 Tax=Castilleja foliolosa TaxID=1961234 RepID=A0ABD3CQJ5_9LAMI